MAQVGAPTRAWRETDRYYSAKVRAYGTTPEGADWRCEATQQMRFVQLLRVCPPQAPYSLNDIGCGWGGLLHFLARRRALRRIDYLGVDLSADMIEAARQARPRDASKFVVGTSPPRVADYSVASGVFNVKLDVPIAHWEGFVRRTLADLRNTSRLGFALNVMVPHAGSPMQLYRPGTERWAAYMERELGVEVETVGGYGMGEATLLARVRRC